MQAKKSVEKMNTLIKMRAQKKEEQDKEIIVEMTDSSIGDLVDTILINRALDLTIRYCPPDYTFNEPTPTDVETYLPVLERLFPKLDKGTITEEEYKTLFLAVVNVQLAKGILDIDTLLSLKQKGEPAEKHYEEHSPQVESIVGQDENEVLCPTEKKSSHFFKVVYETMISPRCLFGFGR